MVTQAYWSDDVLTGVLFTPLPLEGIVLIFAKLRIKDGHAPIGYIFHFEPFLSMSLQNF